MLDLVAIVFANEVYIERMSCFHCDKSLTDASESPTLYFDPNINMLIFLNLRCNLFHQSLKLKACWLRDNKRTKLG